MTIPNVTHVEVTDPDDPMGPPAYGGPIEKAGEVLEPGYYEGAYVHTTDNEGTATLVIRDDRTAYARKV